MLALSTIAVLGTSLISCGEDGEVAELDVPHVFDLNVDPAANVEPVAEDRKDVLPAEALRATLEQGLAWHGITLVETMRAARRGDSDVQSWIDQLVQNTADLTAAIGLAYGPVGARAFNQQWAQHTQFLVDYAVAVGQGNDAAAESARANLTDYAHDSGAFFETATDGTLPANTIEDLLQTHIDHMLSMIDADATGDAGTSVDLAIKDSVHLSSIAHGLATGIASQLPDVFPGQVDTPNAEFCSIVTAQSSSYIIGLLMTDDPSNPLVREAAQNIESATGATTSEVVGFSDHLLVQSDASIADVARDALDHVVEFTGGSSKPTIAPPEG